MRPPSTRHAEGVSTLGEFLRARREYVQPADVGLPDSGRRRTPGLRREEVATLAGVSVDYLVRLEQGRDTNPSPGVLAALSDALLLDDDERLALARVAAVGHSRELCPASRDAEAGVAPTVIALLDQLHPAPSFVVGPYDDVLAWNDAWRQVVGPLGMFDDDPPNLARHLFLHPRARAARPHWAVEADRAVGRLRAASVHWGDHDSFTSLIHDLQEAEGFAERWSTYLPGDERRGTTAIVHPDAGRLRLDYETLGLSHDDQQLITWLPADEQTVASMTAMLDPSKVESPARLRVIS